MRRTLPPLLAAALAMIPLLPSPALAQNEPEVRALWVDSFNPGLRSPAEIDALVERAVRGNFNTILAQVRRNAQSLYAISPEGWIENYDPPGAFDPLQDLLTKAHAAGIEVHAWVNVGPVFSGHPHVPTATWPCGVPCDPNHPFNLHGWSAPEHDDWLTRTHPSYTAGTHEAFPGVRTSSGLWFIDLGNPDAADYLIGVFTQLLRVYDVDGIHLDYIRYPEMPIVSPAPPGSGLAFSTGYNPASVARFNAAYGHEPGSLPDPWDASWSQWRRDQVTAFVRRLYLEMNAIDPASKLSAALITFYRGPNASEPRTFEETEAYLRVFQDWKGWMEEGILDLAIPMIYKAEHTASTAAQFDEWAEFTKDAQSGRHAILGLGAFLNSIESTLAQIEEGRAPSAGGNRAQGFAFFSYNATNAAAGALPARPRDELFRALADDGAYVPQAPFRSPVPVPEMTWKTNPQRGHLLAQIFTENGAPADGALVTIRRAGPPPGDAIVLRTDGNGFAGAIDLEPGFYQLVIGETLLTIPTPIAAGRTAKIAVHPGRRVRTR